MLFAGMQRCSETFLTLSAHDVMVARNALSLRGEQIAPKADDKSKRPTSPREQEAGVVKAGEGFITWRDLGVTSRRCCMDGRGQSLLELLLEAFLPAF